MRVIFILVLVSLMTGGEEEVFSDDVHEKLSGNTGD